MNNNRMILSIKNLNVFNPLLTSFKKRTNVRLLDNINLHVMQGDIIGLVGETGAGKSILLDAIGAKPRPPLYMEAEDLSINADGQNLKLLQLDEEELSKLWGNLIVFIPPNARDKLNPILEVGKQVADVLVAKLNITPKESYKKVVKIFQQVQMPDPEKNYYNYPHELSGGMAQRVLIAIAFSLSPKLLLADEPTMGLDVTIQAQTLDLMISLLASGKSSAILATRDLGIVANYCNKVAVLCSGQLVELCEVHDFFKNAIHPYSKYLLEAAFASHGQQVELGMKVGKNLILEKKNENGCRFTDRCPYAMKICWSSNPTEDCINGNHYVACHAWKEKKLGN